MTEIEYSFRSATAEDAAKVAALVKAAYLHYVELVGMMPRPMTEDYGEVIKNHQVTLAESTQSIVGIIVLIAEDRV
jgi:hypothetical protein